MATNSLFNNYPGTSSFLNTPSSLDSSLADSYARLDALKKAYEQ